MSTEAQPDSIERSVLNEQVVEEVRVWMTRRGLNQTRFAKLLGVNQVWVSRRLGLSRDVDLTFAEVERFATALGVDASDLLPAQRDTRSTITRKPADRGAIILPFPRRHAA